VVRSKYFQLPYHVFRSPAPGSCLLARTHSNADRHTDNPNGLLSVSCKHVIRSQYSFGAHPLKCEQNSRGLTLSLFAIRHVFKYGMSSNAFAFLRIFRKVGGLFGQLTAAQISFFFHIM